MKKIILLTFVLSVITGIALFANGEQEQAVEESSRPWNYSGEDSLTLTGSVKLVDGQRPELITGSEEYELMYPPFLDDGYYDRSGGLRNDFRGGNYNRGRGMMPMRGRAW